MNPAGVVTIGVMARAPVPGRCKTRLAKTFGPEAAAGLYAAMLGDRLDAVSVLPASRRVIVAAPEDDGVRAMRALAPRGWDVIEQSGHDLGARLANAFRKLLDPPSGIVCLVDSDSPTLPFEKQWPRLAAARDAREVVLGPCDDGGYYLIGMRAFEPRLFADVPWSTAAVLGTTLARCAELCLPVALLDAWFDVDEADDVERLASELRHSPDLAPRTANFLREVRG